MGERFRNQCEVEGADDCSKYARALFTHCTSVVHDVLGTSSCVHVETLCPVPSSSTIVLASAHGAGPESRSGDAWASSFEATERNERTIDRS